MSTIESELKYCPYCKDEYRAEFTTCAACNTELISGEQLLADLSAAHDLSMTDSSVDTGEEIMVPVHKGSLQEMKTLSRVLEKASIAAIIAKNENDCGKGCCGPEMLLYVRSQDIGRANSALRGAYEQATALAAYDQSQVDTIFDAGAGTTTCPGCGCQFLPTTPICPDCGLCFS